MEIFELHFNPKIKEHHTFDTFIYEPENVSEKRLGGLYMAGELNNALPKSQEFISNVAKTVKKSFYSLSSQNQEKALSHTLKAANDFLKEEVKRENVNWLGNLDFAVLSIKGDDLVFTKTGDIKILLLRGGQINNIGKNLNLEGIDPYPLKVFFNIASGKLAEDDILLVLSNNVFEFIKERGVMSQMARSKEISAKRIKELIPHQLFTKGEGLKISGLAFIFLFKKEEEKSRLSTILKPSFHPPVQKEEKPKKPFVFPIPIITKPIKASFERIKKISLPKISMPKVKGIAIEKFTKGKDARKKIILIGGFIFLLAIGFFIFKNVEDRKEKSARTALNNVNAIVKQAENFLMVENNEKANELFKQAYIEITPLTEKDTSLMPSIISLKETIEGNLKRLNNLQDIENPETADGQNIIFEPDGTTYDGNYKIRYSINSQEEEKSLQSPTISFSPDLFSSYLSNIYLLDKDNCYIMKYSYLGDFNWGAPKKWHEDFGKTCNNPKSMTIDGSIWVLNGDNSITRYYTGDFQENIKLDIFPFPEDFTEIKTNQSSQYIFILEPKNNRIILMDKNGNLAKQIRSDKFDDLKDIALSDNGKTVYLLNGSLVYKVDI